MFSTITAIKFSKWKNFRVKLIKNLQIILTKYPTQYGAVAVEYALGMVLAAMLFSGVFILFKDLAIRVSNHFITIVSSFSTF